MSRTPIALWLTDTHLSDATVEVNRSVYLQALQICIDNDIKVVIHGGDVFTSRKGQSELVLTTFSKVLDIFSQQGVSFLCIKGNHDAADLSSENSILDIFEGREGFHLYKGYNFTDPNEGLRFHFIPYFSEETYQKYLDQAIANVRFDYKNILFTHVAVKGVMNNDGSRVENELNASKFKHFFKVMVGHYHNRQLVSNNILYTGSTHQANFGEDQEKGITVIFSDGSIQHVKLETPQYITVESKSSDTAFKAVEPNNHYRVKFKYKPQAEEIKLLQSQGYKVVVDYEVEHTDHIQDVKTLFSSEDILGYFEQWCDEKGFEDKEFGLKQLQTL